MELERGMTSQTPPSMSSNQKRKTYCVLSRVSNLSPVSNDPLSMSRIQLLDGFDTSIKLGLDGFDGVHSKVVTLDEIFGKYLG
jgi:hypothetical protein